MDMDMRITVPGDWSPQLTLAMQQLLQHALHSGWPLITCLQPDVTPEQLQDISPKISAVVQDAGLAA
jgi:hypothetical protein